MSGLHRRLGNLEAQVPPPQPSGQVRQHIKEHLDRLAAYRRGDMPEEERADFEEVHAAIERRIREIRKDRGEGGR